MLLQAKEIRKYFNGIRALDGVSCCVEEGEVLGIIGPNGAGKTTLFSVLAGSLRPTSGQVVLSGKAVTGWPPHRVVRAGVCRTHQIVRPFAKLTVEENVLAGLYYGSRGPKSVRRARDEAVSLLEFVGLGSRAGCLPGELTLSGRKKLEIARALATHPRILLLDEVVAGLNPMEAQGAVELVRQVRDRGVSILMIEHVMSAVMSVSDRIMALDRGKVIAEGSPHNVANDSAVISAYLGTAFGEEGTR